MDKKVVGIWPVHIYIYMDMEGKHLFHCVCIVLAGSIHKIVMFKYKQCRGYANEEAVIKTQS